MDDFHKYPFLVRPLTEEEGGGWLIEFPDLPGCMTDGDTIEEAIQNAPDAMKSWIGTAKEFGDPIPEPFSRFKKSADPAPFHSGNIVAAHA
jgi:antitoxin HicB